jgi:hypothetical protein
MIFGCALLTALPGALPVTGQSGGTPESQVNEWHRRPAPAAPPPQSTAARRLLTIRGNNFDALDDTEAAAAYAAANPGAGSVEDRYFLNNPLPVTDSDTVVIATFSDYSVELSPSKHSLYTVVHFAVERVLKARASTVRPGDKIDSLLGGGTLSLNGRVIQYAVNRGDDTPLEAHGRYLLFLKFDPISEDYSIIKHWKLEFGRVIAVDLVEKRRAASMKSEFDGRSESEIIAATEETIRSEGSASQ